MAITTWTDIVKQGLRNLAFLQDVQDTLTSLINPATIGSAGSALPQSVKVKSSDLSRSNLATLTIDPDLQITLSAGATYRYEFFAPFTTTVAGATPGLTFQTAYSGTFTIGTGPFLNPFDGTWSANFGVASAPPAGGPSVSLIAVGSGTNILYSMGSIITTSSGILSLYWCQKTSSATPTTIKASSFLRVIQIG